jgi:hypothetical protein
MQKKVLAGRSAIFVIALVYFLLLLVLALLFFLKRSHLFFLPASFGSVPVGVPWFGALGAVLISLTGVFEHEHDWDTDYWPWHVARPFVGIGLGVVSVLIFQAGILSVNSSLPSQPNNISGNLLYYLIAFLVGYREETFRELIKRLVDVVLSPGGGDGSVPTVHDVAPASAPGSTATQVVIGGSGFTNTQSVKFGQSAAHFTVNSDGQLTATTPAGQPAGAVPLTVTTKHGSATRDFTFTK